MPSRKKSLYNLVVQPVSRPFLWSGGLAGAPERPAPSPGWVKRFVFDKLGLTEGDDAYKHLDKHSRIEKLRAALRKRGANKYCPCGSQKLRAECCPVPLPHDQEGKDPATADAKVGRNDPCHCGSGLKSKKCACPTDPESRQPSEKRGCDLAKQDRERAEPSHSRAEGDGDARSAEKEVVEKAAGYLSEVFGRGGAFDKPGPLTGEIGISERTPQSPGFTDLDVVLDRECLSNRARWFEWDLCQEDAFAILDRLYKAKRILREQELFRETLAYIVKEKLDVGTGLNVARLLERNKECWKFGSVEVCEHGHQQGPWGAMCCKVRFCPASMLVSATRNRKIINRLLGLAVPCPCGSGKLHKHCCRVMVNPFMLTFTLQHTKEDHLAHLVNLLKSSFKKLRRWGWGAPGKGDMWKEGAGVYPDFYKSARSCADIWGGVAFLESTWSHRAGHHPHLHVLIDAPVFADGEEETYVDDRGNKKKRWVPRTEEGKSLLAKTKELWQELLSVHGREAHQVQLTSCDRAAEAAKYVTSPSQITYCKNPETGEYLLDSKGLRVPLGVEIRAPILLELMQTMHRQKAMIPFGSCYGISEHAQNPFMTEDDFEEEEKTCFISDCGGKITSRYILPMGDCITLINHAIKHLLAEHGEAYRAHKSAAASARRGSRRGLGRSPPTLE